MMCVSGSMYRSAVFRQRRSVFAGGHAGFGLKYPHEVLDGQETDILTDVAYQPAVIRQQLLCFFDAKVAEILRESLSIDLTENTAELRRTDAQLGGNAVKGQAAVHVVLPHVFLGGQQVSALTIVQIGKDLLYRRAQIGT